MRFLRSVCIEFSKNRYGNTDFRKHRELQNDVPVLKYETYADRRGARGARAPLAYRGRGAEERPGLTENYFILFEQTISPAGEGRGAREPRAAGRSDSERRTLRSDFPPAKSKLVTGALDWSVADDRMRKYPGGTFLAHVITVYFYSVDVPSVRFLPSKPPRSYLRHAHGRGSRA
ncbi:hypothetical protein EVAR_40500_1 [Eumeta japonica]|uniref:Uncharacterized protein n=1 Tax=Eumeta variegata TaxID=151549 RepID=A0A4C1XZK0_EUMVA|nr:hypothetical protein EVAR_40500_1 [Eumeta japonica]